MEGVVPLSKTRDVVGVLARTVRDIIKVDNILVSKEKKLQIIEDDNFDFKSLRIGIPEGKIIVFIF